MHPTSPFWNPSVPKDRYIGLGILAVAGLASIAFVVVNARRLARRDFAPKPTSLLARWGTPIAVLAVIIAFSFKLALFFKKHPLPKETSPAPEVDIYEWVARESRLKEILAFHRAHGISDEDLIVVLKQVWTENHPGESPPWGLVLGNNPGWWRSTIDWDVELVKRRLLDPGTKCEESGRRGWGVSWNWLRQLLARYFLPYLRAIHSVCPPRSEWIVQRNRMR